MSEKGKKGMRGDGVGFRDRLRMIVDTTGRQSWESSCEDRRAYHPLVLRGVSPNYVGLAGLFRPDHLILLD